VSFCLERKKRGIQRGCYTLERKEMGKHFGRSFYRGDLRSMTFSAKEEGEGMDGGEAFNLGISILV